MSDKLEIMTRNLRELERRAAMYGPGNEPLLLLNQIADLKEQIQRETMDSQDAPVPVHPVDDLGDAVEVSDRQKRADEMEPFVLQLFHAGRCQPQVQVQRSRLGETGPQVLEFSYSSEELSTVMQALTTPVGQLPADHFSPEQVTCLERLGLVESGYLLARMYRLVGQALYQALFPRPVEKLFHAVRAQAQAERRSLALRLVFDAGAADLAGYAWEMVHDDVPLVADGVVDLTRYVACPNPRSSLAVELPLRVLSISPRPSGLASLPPRAEPEAVARGLRPLADQGALEITWLSPPTREALIEYLRQREVHIVHFDGHGNFGRLCPTCHVLHTATSKQCVHCQYPLSTVAAQGHLTFENAKGSVNYVSARSFANALARNRTQVVVLSACRSGQVGGEGVFGGVGPALIQAGVPAMVAMQLSIPVDQAIRFARAFYASLANFDPLVEAVGRGRQQLYDETLSPQAWFVPTLYLRSDDPRGELFSKP